MMRHGIVAAFVTLWLVVGCGYKAALPTAPTNPEAAKAVSKALPKLEYDVLDNILYSPMKLTPGYSIVLSSYSGSDQVFAIVNDGYLVKISGRIYFVEVWDPENPHYLFDTGESSGGSGCGCGPGFIWWVEDGLGTKMSVPMECYSWWIKYLNEVPIADE